MRLAHIYAHPIKAVGLEERDTASLEPGKTLPGDRIWAIEHEASKYDPAEGWGRCMNFIRGASSPQLMAVRIEALGDGATYRLTHPDRPDLLVKPDADPDDLIDWVRPLCNPDRSQPVRLVRATRQGMTDSSHPTVSLLSLSSLAALSETTGMSLARERFRGNLWLDGAEPWEEFTWIGRRLQIGETVLEVTKPIERCKATTVNPKTGISDADTLGALHSSQGHQDFGVQAMVIEGGDIRTGDGASLL